MALALEASAWIGRIEYPDPAQFATDEAWVAALFAGQSARGPSHGAEPTVSYASLWTLWLSALPYGLWSDRISRAGLEEWRQWVGHLGEVLGKAMAHYGLRLRDGIALADLASAVASLVEGAWLNQCLTTRHPLRDSRARCGHAAERGADALAWGGSSSALEPARPTTRTVAPRPVMH